MLTPFQVVLMEYDPDWPRRAVRHAASLRVLGPCLVAVHHIGSTSVPGLAAKPIIDLMPVVTDLESLDAGRRRVEALGYGWHGELGIDGRRYCTLCSEDGTRIVQLHCFQADSPHLARHLAFRDYLCAHPEAAAEYENEKRRARDLHPDDSHAYSTEKGPWILKMETRALDWFNER